MRDDRRGEWQRHEADAAHGNVRVPEHAAEGGPRLGGGLLAGGVVFRFGACSNEVGGRGGAALLGLLFAGEEVSCGAQFCAGGSGGEKNSTARESFGVDAGTHGFAVAEPLPVWGVAVPHVRGLIHGLVVGRGDHWHPPLFRPEGGQLDGRRHAHLPRCWRTGIGTDDAGA